MDTRTGRSIFDSYYSRIQELLFAGMSIKEVYDYVEKYFGINSTYNSFWGYVNRRNLDWFMPEKE